MEAVEEIEDHENEDGDPDALASFILVVAEEFHRGPVEVVHEDRDDRGEAEACEKACVACHVQRQVGVVTIVETAELFDRDAERDFSERYQEKYDGEVEEKVSFLRGTDYEVHADDGDAVAEKKREVPNTVNSIEMIIQVGLIEKALKRIDSKIFTKCFNTLASD
jgi:hypothetical protein